MLGPNLDHIDPAGDHLPGNSDNIGSLDVAEIQEAGEPDHDVQTPPQHDPSEVREHRFGPRTVAVHAA